ncbi:hypothetical protein [Arthrobacter alpinus]|nr:hypothetical protein [Arthrobacter alpinus]
MTPTPAPNRQDAAHCGVPSANTAFKTAQPILAGLDAEPHFTEQKDELP